MQNLTASSNTHLSTVTATMPAITHTQTISQILTETISNSLTTATALCYVGSSDDGILAKCTATEAGPIATNSSPAKSHAPGVSPLKIFKFLAAIISRDTASTQNGYRHAHTQFHARGLERRNPGSACSIFIFTTFFSALFGLFTVCMGIFLYWQHWTKREQTDLMRWSVIVSGCACIVFVGFAYAERGQC